MANSCRVLLFTLLGFLTLFSITTITTTQVQAAFSSSTSSALARRLLSSSSSLSSESKSPPYNSPARGSNASPDINMPPAITMPDSPPSQSQSSGGMQPKNFGKGSCNSWRQKLGQVQKLISTMSTIANVFKGNSNNNNGDEAGNNNKNGYSDMKVMDALMSDSKEAYTTLAREGITSLLNAYTFEGFAYTPDQVRHFFNVAYFGHPRDVAKQATLFQRANEQLV